jgi:hypothetical protein
VFNIYCRLAYTGLEAKLIRIHKYITNMYTIYNYEYLYTATTLVQQTCHKVSQLDCNQTIIFSKKRGQVKTTRA